MTALEWSKRAVSTSPMEPDTWWVISRAAKGKVSLERQFRSRFSYQPFGEHDSEEAAMAVAQATEDEEWAAALRARQAGEGEK